MLTGVKKKNLLTTQPKVQGVLKPTPCHLVATTTTLKRSINTIKRLGMMLRKHKRARHPVSLLQSKSPRLTTYYSHDRWSEHLQNPPQAHQERKPA
jgi:hypothetical protein